MHICTFLLADPEYSVRNTKLILSRKQQKGRSHWGERLHSIGVSVSNGGAERVTLELEGIKISKTSSKYQMESLNLRNAIKYARKALVSRAN